MTSKDIYNRILFIENRIFGLKLKVNRIFGLELKVNSHYISNSEYIDTINSRAELNKELTILKKKLKLNNIRKEKLQNLNNI